MTAGDCLLNRACGAQAGLWPWSWATRWLRRHARPGNGMLDAHASHATLMACLSRRVATAIILNVHPAHLGLHANLILAVSVSI
jgi:hypothetical protein